MPGVHDRAQVLAAEGSEKGDRCLMGPPLPLSLMYVRARGLYRCEINHLFCNYLEN